MKPSDDVREVVRIIEEDHRTGIDQVARLSDNNFTIRGIAVSLSVALAGLAFANQGWELAFGGALIVVVAATAEAMNDFLRLVTQNRTDRLENKLQAYVDYLLEDGLLAADASERLHHELDTYQAGTSTSLRPSSIGIALMSSLNRAVFWTYPALLVILGLVAWNTFVENDESDVCVATESGDRFVVEEVLRVISGELELIACPSDE